MIECMTKRNYSICTATNGDQLTILCTPPSYPMFLDPAGIETLRVSCGSIYLGPPETIADYADATWQAASKPLVALPITLLAGIIAGLLIGRQRRISR